MAAARGRLARAVAEEIVRVAEAAAGAAGLSRGDLSFTVWKFLTLAGRGRLQWPKPSGVEAAVVDRRASKTVALVGVPGVPHGDRFLELVARNMARMGVESSAYTGLPPLPGVPTDAPKYEWEALPESAVEPAGRAAAAASERLSHLRGHFTEVKVRFLVPGALIIIRGGLDGASVCRKPATRVLW